MPKMNRLSAIRTYFMQKDNIAPNGGREMPTVELKPLTAKDKDELSQMAAKELGAELDT